MSAVMSAATFARLFPVGIRVRIDGFSSNGPESYGRVVSSESPALDRSVVTVRFRSADPSLGMVEHPVHVDRLWIRLHTSGRYVMVRRFLALRELFPIGSVVHTRRLHVSRSGMLRTFAVIVDDPARGIRDVSGMVADVIGTGQHNNGGVKMGGCGMDMGFALAYSLASTLYREEFLCTGTRYATNEGDPEGTRNACPSNDHVNDRGGADYRTDRLHSDAGYALAHRHLY